METLERECIRILIIDDEPAACNNLNHILSCINNDINVVGIAHNTLQAEEQIKHTQPQVIFLDIDMPGEDAFHFLERIAPINFEVIFVTAYHEYAIKAFKLNAVDYILKPIDVDELERSFCKAKHRITSNKILSTYATRPQDLLQLISTRKEQEHIILRSQHDYEIVFFKDILYIEAMRSYAKVVYSRGQAIQSKIMSSSIAVYENMLPDNIFFRVHKSYLVNCYHVKTILKEKHELLILNNEVKMPIARRRLADLMAFLKNINSTIS